MTRIRRASGARRRLILSTGCALVLVMGVAGALGCSHYVRVESPPPITAAATPQLTEQAILEALPRRSWTAEEIKVGEIVAFLSVKAHWLRVSIRYDNAKVIIVYLDSDNLRYTEKNGQPYIHKAWRKWSVQLAREIERSITRLTATAATVAVQPTDHAQPVAQPAQPVPAPGQP